MGETIVGVPGANSVEGEQSENRTPLPVPGRGGTISPEAAAAYRARLNSPPKGQDPGSSTSSPPPTDNGEPIVLTRRTNGGNGDSGSGNGDSET